MRNHLKLISLLFTALLFLSGCKDPKEAEQRRLYDRAVQMEQSIGGDSSIYTISSYQDVVRFDPTSDLGILAQKRIDRIRENIHQKKLERNQMLTPLPPLY